MRPPEATRDRLLFHLKTKGPQTASELARRLGTTAVAARQHLERLAAEDLVTAEADVPRRGAGRPARRWRLTAAGHGRFPEGYAELTVGLIGAMRDAFGEDALERLVDARTRTQRVAYAQRMKPARSLAKRVAALARLRTEEGYMAEWKRHADGSFTLVENHCPICAAAELCQGLCAGELQLFRDLLGPGVDVERTEHVLEGARRCTYRVAPLRRR